jgi:two-component system KDP operon response regulator KdpE
MTLRLLLVEDDRELRATLRAALQVEGYEVLTAVSLSEGIAMLAHAGRTTCGPAPAHGSALASAPGSREPAPAIDAVLLDLGLPDGDGETLLAHLRKQHKLPVLVISARQAEGHKVRLLDAGADDYLVKPFGIAELLARLRVALRHRGTTLQPAITLYRRGDIDIDLAVPQVLQAGAPVHLTPTELRLLAVLVRGAGRVSTHRQLLADVWGAEFVEHTHYLRLYMAQLRAKLEADPAEPQLLLTEAGVGYRLVEPEA